MINLNILTHCFPEANSKINSKILNLLQTWSEINSKFINFNKSVIKKVTIDFYPIN
jgi:hypothetical protein